MERELNLIVDPYRNSVEFYCGLELTKINPHNLGQQAHRCSWMMKMDRELYYHNGYEQLAFKQNIEDHLKNVHGDKMILDKLMNSLFRKDFI